MIIIIFTKNTEKNQMCFAPNGKRETDKGNVKLYLLLCALPPTIVLCKIKYT